jgi:hydroxymethylpyrimidine pyrophosphatase-like HAD family hydrolase
MPAVANYQRAEFPGVGFAGEYGDRFAAEPDYVHDWDINPEFDRKGRRIPEPLLAHLDVIAAQPAMKLLAKDRSIDVDVFLDSAVELIGDRASITHSSSFGLLEISAHGVTKATGLAELADQHGVAPHEVIAIGDMPNDLPMLQWAGHSYAVSNAHPSVLAIADEVVGSNDEDAVAALIEQLLER